MRQIKFLVATLLLSSSLQTMASDNPVTLPKDAVDSPAETLGTVIGTIGYRSGMKETKMEGATLVFRKTGSPEQGQINFQRSWIGIGGNARAIEDGKFKYAAFKMALPEGQYEIIRVIGHYNTTPATMICTGNCGITTANERDFSVPFEVKRGKVLYLGSFLATGTLEMSKLGFIPLPMPSTVYFSYADKWQRDQKAFAAGGDLAIEPAGLVEHAALLVNQRADYYLMAEDHLPVSVTMRDVTSGRASFDGRIAAYKAAHPDDSNSGVSPDRSAAPSPPGATATLPVTSDQKGPK